MPEAIQQLLNFIEAHPWIAITFALIGFFASNLFGSWAKLTKRYAAQHHFTGKTWNWQTVSIGNAAYSNCVTVGSNSQGLYLSPPIIFRLGYPAILIPWEHLHLRTKDRLLEQVHFFEIDNCKGIQIIISDRLLHRISQASEGKISLSSDEMTAQSSEESSSLSGQVDFNFNKKLCLKIFAITFAIGLTLGFFRHGFAQYQACQFPERHTIYSKGEYVSPKYGENWPDTFTEFLGLSQPVRVKVEQQDKALISETYYSVFGTSIKIEYHKGEWVSTSGGIFSAPLFSINCLGPLCIGWFGMIFSGVSLEAFYSSKAKPGAKKQARFVFKILIHAAITGLLTYIFLYSLPETLLFLRTL